VTFEAPAAHPLLAALPIAPFRTPYAPDDDILVHNLLRETRLEPEVEEQIDRDATESIRNIRYNSSGIGGVEEFLKEYSFSTREGLTMMVLAEALLRVPDAATTDRLIEDKLSITHFDEHEIRHDSFLINASTWALGVTSRIVSPTDTPEGIISGMVKRLGVPAIRTATRKAMHVLGHHFVLGETIESALDRAKAAEKRGYRHSFDMLGEAARTRADAERYYQAYIHAIEAIGKVAGDEPLPDRGGISIKLSALHPRYEAVNELAVIEELAPRLLQLAQKARAHNLNLTVDAEEADRLEISLDLIGVVAADPSLTGWDGFGLAVQAYQKRAPEVIDWVSRLAKALDRRFMVRLVKGAYWDTEISRAQRRGLADFPVYTRKAATDLTYLACARRLLLARPRLFPQFATHNALTATQIAAMAGDKSGFEFQKLLGMGDSLFKEFAEDRGFACRVYAPVGGHRDLLAYLVRRLLENGANSSFVAAVGDGNVPIQRIIERPATLLANDKARHSRIRRPLDLYGPERRNSAGLEFGHTSSRAPFADAIASHSKATIAATPLVSGAAASGAARQIVSPVDRATVIGSVVDASAELAGEAIAAARTGFRAWSARPVAERAAALTRMADLLEANRDRLIALMALETGKTLADGLAELREAVDFCRYYAVEAERLFGETRLMPGPTGEENRYRYRGRGVFACISPWNRPLSVFLGQVAAALVSGNAVVAKPAEQASLTAFEAVKLLHQAGIPAEILQFLPGDGALGEAIVADERIAGVAFTGSTEVAHSINRTLAARNGAIVPLIAESGGINAMIVDATALPEQVADDVVASAFRSAGQRSSALRLLFVQDDVADHILEMVIGAAAELRLGDPRKLATDIGPVIDTAARDALLGHIEAMQAAGQQILFAGSISDGAPDGGAFVTPHVIALDGAERLESEVFGPILHVVRFRAEELEQVLEKIAATGYGLTLGIQSRIDSKIENIIERMPTGNIYVNRDIVRDAAGTQPFGGTGLSGTGPKAGGPVYLLRFASEQAISINTASAGGNASLLAMGDE